MAVVLNNTVAKDAIKKYRACVKSIEKDAEGIFFTDDQLALKHRDSRKEAIRFFKYRQMDGIESSSSAFLDELKKVLII